MKRQIITTDDGSKTIRIEDWNEHYHSTHGAIQEALHVYIKAGLDYFLSKNKPTSITVLEAGFGTGLNALLASLWSETHQVDLDYIGLEAYPILQEEQDAMDYDEALGDDKALAIYNQMHQAKWEDREQITGHFRIKKQQCFFSDLELKTAVDVVFYDAFGPRVQPELWEENIFQRFYDALKPGGVFVTYSVKGTAKRALQSIGFEVDIIEGPPGKRHMMRAYKGH